MYKGTNSFGNLDLVLSSVICGWAIIDNPQIIPEIIIYADECELCRVKADVFRKDLFEKKLHHSGFCGFEARNFDRRKLRDAKRVRAFISQTKKELACSPLILKNRMSEYKDLEYNPLIFVHIPKTAGTSFRIAAQAYFGEGSVLKDYGKDSQETSKNILDTVYESNRALLVNELVSNKVKFFTGHFHVSKYSDIFDTSVRWCVFLRDPIQRTISEYRHLVREESYDKPLEYFCSLKEQCNRQYKLIKGMNLDQFYFIGITEYYSESIDLFNNFGGYKFEKLKLNTYTKRNIHYIRLDNKQLEIMERNNALDIELYNSSLKIFKRRLKEHNVAYR